MPSISHLIIANGYWMVALLVGIESLGVPVPGETTLIIASVYVATTAKLKLWLVIASAAAGGVIGDNIGFMLGRKLGYWLLLRYGAYVWLSPARIKVGQLLFLRHGRRVIFLGRFLPVLRELAAFLAGANQMRWPPFFGANSAGAALWASVYGVGAYLLGKSAAGSTTLVQVAVSILAGTVFLSLSLYLYRNERELEAQAEQALPGPLQPPWFWRRRFKREAPNS